MVSRKRYSNSILQSIPASGLAWISPELSEIDLAKGTLLIEPDAPNRNVYFPIDSIISFVGDTGEGGSIEVWSVGNEGVAGISGILGRTKPFRGVVQVAGKAIAVRTTVLRKTIEECQAFQDAILAYLDHLLTQISYLGLCNNNHSIEQRLCRWLLMVQDRAGTGELSFTQDGISGILGTRRATISVAAAALQSAGLISYTPGMIRIRSRRALEKAACRCYRIINSSGV